MMTEFNYRYEPCSVQLTRPSRTLSYDHLGPCGGIEHAALAVEDTTVAARAIS